MTPTGRPWQGAQPVHGSADTSYRRIGEPDRAVAATDRSNLSAFSEHIRCRGGLFFGGCALSRSLQRVAATGERAFEIFPVHREANCITIRVTPPEIAPNAAPLLPPASAPTAVAIPAVPAIIKASRFQDRRRPPHTRIFAAFIGSPREKIRDFNLDFNLIDASAFRNKPHQTVVGPNPSISRRSHGRVERLAMDGPLVSRYLTLWVSLS